MSQDLQVQGHENNAQKLQLEVCKGKSVTATPGCIGEGGRVGSQVKWKPLSMRKVKAIFNMRITLSLPSALMYSQVGSHLQRAILCSACPLVLQASHLSPRWFTTRTWSDTWWKSTLGRSQCYLEQPQVRTVGSLNLGSLQGWCNHRELSLEDELETDCLNLSTVIVTLMKKFVFLDQVQKRGYFTTSSVSGYSSWYIWQMANNVTVRMTKNSSRTPAGAALSFTATCNVGKPMEDRSPSVLPCKQSQKACFEALSFSLTLSTSAKEHLNPYPFISLYLQMGKRNYHVSTNKWQHLKKLGNFCHRIRS